MTDTTSQARSSKFAWLRTAPAIIGICIVVSAGVLTWQLITGQDPVFGQVALLGTVIALASTTLTR